MVLGAGWCWCWCGLSLVLGAWAQEVPFTRDDVSYPTETEGEADTTHTTWEYSDIPGDLAPYTWPDVFLADLVWRFQESTPFWPPPQQMKWPNPGSGKTEGPDPKMKEFPAFDPWVWRTTTELPSRKYGHVILAQSYYMLVNLNGDYESCTQVIFEEKIFDFLQRKDCLPSYNKKWFWTYPWVPDMIHNLRVKDRSTKKVLFLESYYSLSEKPPTNLNLDITNGMGFTQLTFRPPFEKGPSLNGYVIFYRNTLEGDLKDRWLDVVSMYVVYNERFPYVRPTHPCEDFRKDRTFCILVLDHVSATEYTLPEAKYYMQMSTFRIVPGPWKPHFVKHWLRSPYAHICYWMKQKHCAEIMGTGTKGLDYPHREKYRPKPTRKTTTEPPKFVPAGGMDDLHSFPNVSRGPAMLRGLRHEDLTIIFAGLTLLLLLIGAPCVYFLGQQSGQMAAEDRWARLASMPGVVNVPLGHGGAFWRGRAALPGAAARAQ